MSDSSEGPLSKMNSSGDNADGIIPNGRRSPIRELSPENSLLNGESEEG